MNQYLVRRFEHFCAYLEAEADEGAADVVEDNIINIAAAPSFQQPVQAAQTEAEVLDLIDETWFTQADDDLCALVVERLPDRQ